MKSLGKHIILELYGCHPDILNDRTAIEGVITEAVVKSGATIIKPFFHQFAPQGVSGIVVIAESHFAIHTWPEYGYAAVDIFTCGETINCDAAAHFVKEHLKAKSMQAMEIKRGALDIPPEDLKHK
ncbi:MAG: adenosylmethionine decarboxylase [Pseudomonadota bacterium]